jgi:DNA-binding MarR family transcriptional regulator
VTLDDAVLRVQVAYPQVYHACHTRHVRRRSSPVHLSPRDSEVLVHLDRREPMTLSTLARHMDLAASTLSEAVSTLETLGYVTKSAPAAGDRRRIGLVLSAKGVDAIRASSVLEAGRLRAAFGRLSAPDRAAVVHGLELLATASRPVARRKGR